jgi:hypothetical protein
VVVVPLPYPVPLVFVAADAVPKPTRLTIANAPTPNDNLASKALDLIRSFIFISPLKVQVTLIMIMDIMRCDK